MNHTPDSANQMIKVAALVIGATYLYRRLTEGSAEEVKASTKIAPLGQFVIGWGVLFFALSVVAPAAPSLAGNMAFLVMVGSLLANGTQVSKDLQNGMQHSLQQRRELNQLPHQHRRGGRNSGADVPSSPPPPTETRSA